MRSCTNCRMRHVQVAKCLSGSATRVANRSVKDFVRRRRWIRTRVPLDSDAARQVALSSAPMVMVDGQLQRGIEDGLVAGASPPRLHEALSFPRRGVIVRPCPKQGTLLLCRAAYVSALDSLAVRQVWRVSARETCVG